MTRSGPDSGFSSRGFSSGGVSNRGFSKQGLLVGAFAVLFTAPIWLFDRLPMQDLPNHLAIVATLATEDLVGGWHDVFENRLDLKPYAGYYWATLLLGRVVGVEIANRLVLTFYVLASVWAFNVLVRGGRGSPRSRSRRANGTSGQRRANETLASLLLLPLLYNDFYLIGMTNFLVSLPLLVAVVTVARRLARDAAKATAKARMVSGLVLALCALALVFAHPFSWIIGCLLALVSLRGRWPCLIGAAGLLPSAAVFVQTMGSRAALSSTPIWHEPLFKLRYFVSSPAMVAEAANRLFFWVALVVWLVLLIVASVRAWRDPEARASRSAWLLVAGLALAYCVAPFAVGAAVWLDGRIVLFFWGTLLFALAPFLLRTRIEVLAAVLVNLLVLSAVLQGHRAFDEEIAPLAEIIDTMPPNARVLWLPFDRTSEALKPFYQESGRVPYTLYAHAGSYYHVAKGGLSPSMTFHASLPWIPLGLKDELFRRAFTVADPFAPEQLVVERTELLQAFDFLLVRGPQGKFLEPVAEPLLWQEDYALYRPRTRGPGAAPLP